MKKQLLVICALFCLVMVCQAQASGIMCGDEQTESYFPLLKNKRVALFSNHTGLVKGRHLIDVLLAHHFNVVGVFSPEHGFRGKADAGETVGNSIDEETGVQIYSLYKGEGGKPDEALLNKTDILLVDIQDVGLRFYTYYISMYKLMDVCAERRIPVVILDRPNPNGFYVDGPLLDMKYKSGVGALPIPVVHGMTLAELALMINGEGWLSKGRKCPLQVVACKNYTHQSHYDLPVPPSPNLPNMKSIYLYPSTCYFEGTVASLGRGTDKPFQIYGHPLLKGGTYDFIPRSISGAKNPPLLNEQCHGVNLTMIPNEDIWKNGLDLSYVIDAYRKIGIGDKFFTPFFEKLIGVGYVRKMIESGHNAKSIKARWKNDVKKFKIQRKPYLLYPE
ncbi:MULTISPECIES: exo-beta-N-acetylmuramidase NamZ domain-containing protein [unclassified Prevotella]|uniref:exo-beta-N-acetylmuramidase NamZ family protein n=1 Tax=unclassified Prevotella TaxID=2638335 RepID=UPI0005129FE8|nr:MULTISPECIES: DUF1343 domain-containing protein [unclassified Prevotella]KGI60687.1 hypothetical protein HMPREF0671_04560 [Prevotella sp. S7 MS 2]